MRTDAGLRPRDLSRIALGAALIAVCAWITVPGPVPFTMQTFGVFAVTGLLGGRRGTLAVLVYVLLGAIGLPLFAGFGAGFGVLFGATGGYVLGFLAITLCAWLGERCFGGGLRYAALSMTVGLFFCYAFGTAWFLAVYTRANGPLALGTALGWCVGPFVLPDVIKLALALLASRRIGKLIRL